MGAGESSFVPLDLQDVSGRERDGHESVHVALALLARARDELGELTTPTYFKFTLYVWYSENLQYLRRSNNHAARARELEGVCVWTCLCACTRVSTQKDCASLKTLVGVAEGAGLLQDREGPLACLAQSVRPIPSIHPVTLPDASPLPWYTRSKTPHPWKFSSCIRFYYLTFTQVFVRLFRDTLNNSSRRELSVFFHKHESVLFDS